MPKLVVAISLYTVVAWRINRLMRLGRECPDLNASLVFEQDEWMAAYILNEKEPPKKVSTVNEVVRLIAYNVDDVITGLTANIYKRTAVEVFWNRVPGSEIRYLIDKDGETLTTIDGTSWYYDSFLADGTSLVSVSAIYPDGQRVDGSAVLGVSRLPD